MVNLAVLACVLITFSRKKVHHPEKILATPMIQVK